MCCYVPGPRSEQEERPVKDPNAREGVAWPRINTRSSRPSHVAVTGTQPPDCIRRSQMNVGRYLRARLDALRAHVGRRADSALDQFERFASMAPPAASTVRVRLTCVFLQWDPDRAPSELDALAKQLHYVPGLETTIVLVNNRKPETPPATNENASIVVGGDNSAYEFSGLQTGIDAARSHGIRTDVWLLANDRYRAANRPFLRYLTAPTVQAAMALPGIVGHIDAYPRTVWSYGYPIRRWITTSFLLLSDDVLKRCSPLVSVTADDLDASLDCTDPTLFVAGGPVGPDHAAFLLTWLTGAEGTEIRSRWYGAAPLASLDPTVVRRKVQSILNEQLLSARALASGVLLIPMRVAHRLGVLGLDHPATQRERHRILQEPGLDGIAATGPIHRFSLALRILLSRLREKPKK
jgi:hypothetical protein